jgi:hypothetical protein
MHRRKRSELAAEYDNFAQNKFYTKVLREMYESKDKKVLLAARAFHLVYSAEKPYPYIAKELNINYFAVRNYADFAMKYIQDRIKEYEQAEGEPKTVNQSVEQ